MLSRSYVLLLLLATNSLVATEYDGRFCDTRYNRYKIAKLKLRYKTKTCGYVIVII